MKKTKLIILALLVLGMISIVGCESCCEDDLPSGPTPRGPSLNTNTAVNLNTNPDSADEITGEREFALTKPEIEGITLVQLHTGNELPHRYDLTANGSFYPGRLTDELNYFWSIDCGYFYVNNKNVGQSTGEGGMTIEWRYDRDLECIDAKATVYASDPEGFEDGEPFTKKLFIDY